MTDRAVYTNPSIVHYVSGLLKIRYQDSMENRKMSSSPPRESSVSPENKCYITNLVIECKPDDTMNNAFNSMRITIFALGSENGDAVSLEKVSPTMWKHQSAIELPATTDGFMIIAQSEEGGDLGNICFAGAELKRSTMSEASDNHVRREFTTEVDGPTLTVSFQTCVIPSAGSTVEQGNQDILAAADLERDFALLGMTPDDDPAKPGSLITCGRLFLERFRHTGSRGDIDNSILAYEKAIQLTPKSNVRFVNVLSEAGRSLLERYDVTGRLSDVDKAVSMFESSVDGTPEGHADMPGWLSNLGNSLLLRFEHTRDLSDISKAISVLQKAVHLTPNDYSDMPDQLNNLGNAFFLRFERTGDLRDISEAISVLRKAVHLTPNGHSAMPGWLNNLGTSVLRRFEYTGDLSDISEAISFLQKAVHLTSNNHSDMPGMLTNLGNSLRRRFECTGDLSDISEAICVQQKGVHLTPNGHSDMPSWLSNLGSSFLRRFERTGDLSDISEAVSVQEKAVHLIPDGHSDMPGQLNNLGASFLRRFERTGDFSDVSRAISVLQKAVRITPNGHLAMRGLLNNLGASLRRRFERTGDLSDISEAISVLQKAVQITPNDHSDMPGWLSNLGSLFLRRFECTGDLRDISEAISVQQKAVHLTPNGHSNMPSRLHNLGTSFLRRFERTRDLHDISEAISAQQKAVDLTPNGHSNMPTRLNDLGNSFLIRFTHTRDLSDISKAISFQQKAVHLTPNGHSEMPNWLNNLGISFSCCFECTGDLSKISEAISVQQKAVHLTPNGHSEMPGRLSNLGNSFSHRFEQTGDLTDISEAISVQQKAIHLTPKGHSNMPDLLGNLGHSFLCRFEHTRDLTDTDTAISNYHLAATSSTGSPLIRLKYAREWAKLSQVFNPTQTLVAYSVAIRLVSQVAGLEQTIQRRHTNLRVIDISDLSTSAAAAALSFGNCEMALEWLEQGRCLVWNQLNNLRTPIDDLRACDPTLADHFLMVSRALENSGSRADSGSLGIEASMARKMTLQAEANAHVKLAQIWDQLLAKIRNISDFQDFLQPPQTLHLLEHLPTIGPVVLINVHKTRCDALALRSNADAPHHIPLPGLSYEQADALRGHLYSYLRSHGVRSHGSELDTRGTRPQTPHRDSSKGIQDILSELWSLVVRPILDGLAIVHPTTDPSRIWWCATGPLAFLPIHAAGLYGQSNHAPGHCLSDFAVSSYTPTVSALIERVRHPRKTDIASRKFLLISQPNTPGLSSIPGTTAEIQAVMTIMEKDSKVEASHLEKDAATLVRVSQEMATHSSIHLACHAIQDVKNPLQSGFFLHDGRLGLSEIIKRQTTNADLAFLSACQTSSGDEKLSEEAVHLAAGMLAAGYRGVVATMWSIMDRYGPEIAADFYENLLSSGIPGGEEGLNSAGAAHALHYATRRIREKLGHSEESALLAWVPYVHFGL